MPLQLRPSKRHGGRAKAAPRSCQLEVMLLLATGIRLYRQDTSIIACTFQCRHSFVTCCTLGFCNDTIWPYPFAAASRLHWIQLCAYGFVHCKKMPCKHPHELEENLIRLVRRPPSHMPSHLLQLISHIEHMDVNQWIQPILVLVCTSYNEPYRL